MNPLDRREFLLLSAAAALASTAKADDKPSTGPANNPPAGPAVVIDAGPMSKYATAGIYDEFAHYDDDDDDAFKAFFIVRTDDAVYALSGVCTHKGCIVEKQSDGTFQCPCHDSKFTPSGKCVPGGKAKTSLYRLAVRVDERQHVLVDVKHKVSNPA